MSLPEAERFARLRLARTSRIGPVAFSQLLGRYGSAIRALDALPGLLRKSGAALPPPREAVERELAAAERIGARLLTLGDPDYRRCWPRLTRRRPSCGSGGGSIC